MTKGEMRYKLNEVRMMINDGEHIEEQEILCEVMSALDSYLENKGDSISRQAVLELTEHLEADFANSFDPHTLAEIYRRVKELPSVENERAYLQKFGSH